MVQVLGFCVVFGGILLLAANQLHPAMRKIINTTARDAVKIRVLNILIYKPFLISSSILSRETTPTRAPIDFPSLKSCRVGIDIMPRPAAVWELSSMLMRTNFTLFVYWVSNSSTIGPIALQAPHQGAQKSTSTGSLELSTSLLKLESFAFNIYLCLPSPKFRGRPEGRIVRNPAF